MSLHKNKNTELNLAIEKLNASCNYCQRHTSRGPKRAIEHIISTDWK